MCGVISRSVSATGWSVRQIGRIVFWRDGLYSLVVEFGQQLALWIPLCVATAAVLFFSVKHFVPSAIERILRGLKPLLLLLQAPHSGDKPFVEVLLFQVPFRDDVCIIVRTVLLSGDRLMSFTLDAVVIGQQLCTMFAVRWLILLHHWVHVVVVSFVVDRDIILSCAVIAVFAVAGLNAAPTLALWLLLKRVILRCILPFLAVVFFGCVHHVYVI